MRWAPLHPRQLLAIAVASLLTMLLMMWLAAADLATLDFSLGSATAESDTSSITVPDRVEADEAPPPVWVTDPLAPPLGELRR